MLGNGAVRVDGLAPRERASSPASWDRYNEGVLALRARARRPDASAARPAAGTRWTANSEVSWGDALGRAATSHFAPLFGHQYSHVWVDFRGIRDRVDARGTGSIYFENSRRATYAQQRNYAIANPETLGRLRRRTCGA